MPRLLGNRLANRAIASGSLVACSGQPVYPFLVFGRRGITLIAKRRPV